jgi:NTP pyrophosphatase (non-canonical NTP hydrolase)
MENTEIPNTLSDVEYIKLAARTESNGTTLSGADRLCHAALGLLTEIVEFQRAKTRENRLEELGDTLWYLALIARVLGHDSFEPFRRSAGDLYSEITEPVADIADVAKRWKFYGSEPDVEKLTVAVSVIIGSVAGAAERDGVAMDRLAASNIYKLRQRYPDRFTQAAAENRDTEKEIAAVAAVVAAPDELPPVPVGTEPKTSAPATADSANTVVNINNLAK